MRKAMIAGFLLLCATLAAVADEPPETHRIHWGTLKQVEWVEVPGTEDDLLGSEFRIRISDAVKALDGTTVRIKGFITPIDHVPGKRDRHDHGTGEGDHDHEMLPAAEEIDGEMAHRRFIFAAMPHSGCNYCASLTPESMIRVEASEPILFSYGAIEIFGTLLVDEDDPDGIVYRLRAAAPYR